VSSSGNRWSILAKVCETVGFIAFLSLFTAWLVLFFYYGWDRPVGPRPDSGWTEHLGWGRYGSRREAGHLFWLLWYAIAAFGVIAVGKAVRIYKLGENVFRTGKRY
jgi:hypothetical protein